jgi:hypothetical protein
MRTSYAGKFNIILTVDLSGLQKSNFTQEILYKGTSYPENTVYIMLITLCRAP